MKHHCTSLVGRYLCIGALLAVLMLATLPAAAHAQTFSDVRGDEYYASALERLCSEGVVQGRADGTFGAAGLVTRAQLAVFLARALELPNSCGAPFADLSPEDWSYGAVSALYWAGLVSGTGPAQFSPDVPVSRQQAAALVIGALAYLMNEQPQPGVDLAPASEGTGPWLAGFRDRSFIAVEHAESVATAYRLGVVEGSAGGWYYPASSLTRAQMVVMLHRALYLPIVVKTAYPEEMPAESYPAQSVGDRGPVVQALEARLTILGYPCGPVDGVYDYRTKDAVMAFEKVERIGRNGTAGSEVWERVFSAQTPVPRLTLDGNRAEVDLARQVLFMIEDNVVVKILHVSTGKLGTPTGRGRVYLKNSGWVHVPVGWMYSPSYIMPHIAIHGSKSVPPYPASHGCVRTPVWATDELYRELPIGLRVDVYY